MRRFAFVTGSSRGIGASLCSILLDRGWSVIGAARGPAAPGLDPERYAHLALDLGELGSVIRAVDTILAQPNLETWDQIALVNNAGRVQPVGSLDQTGLLDLDRSLRINLTAPLWIAGRFLRLLPASVPLRIAHLGSGAATSPYSGWTSYCTAKAGLSMAARCLAEDLEHMPHLAERDVRVLDYSPGVVATQMQEQIRATPTTSFPKRQRFVDLHEEGSLVDPSRPASELADLLEDAKLPAYSARRFGS